MSNILQSEFDVREIEINRYFDFLEKLEMDYRVLKNYSDSESFNITEDLSKILKSNGLLLLYNLIESTVTNSINQILDQLKIEGICYKELSKDMKKFCLSHRYQNDEKQKTETAINTFEKIIDEIINDLIIEIKVERIKNSGTLNIDNIDKIAKSLGVRLSKTHFRENKHLPVFKSIAKHRNDLAHGKRTFSEIGREISFSGSISGETITDLGLIHFKQFTIEHMSNYILSINKFIQDKKYKLAV